MTKAIERLVSNIRELKSDSDRLKRDVKFLATEEHRLWRIADVQYRTAVEQLVRPPWSIRSSHVKFRGKNSGIFRAW